MKYIQVDPQELADYRANNKTLYCRETINGVRKELYMTHFGGFEIHLNGEIVHQQIQPFAIAEQYNNMSVNDYITESCPKK